MRNNRTRKTHLRLEANKRAKNLQNENHKGENMK
uniref:Uncharacterized protein n=1 Tax=Rhizophora mucronata TaxID=61149 RepID=A0A2P2NBY2_RHIMU